jgi:hypothetical protein
MNQSILALAMAASIAACGGTGEPSGAGNIDDSEHSSGISADHVATPPILTDRAEVRERCRAEPEIVFGAVDETGTIHPVRCLDYLNTVPDMAPALSAPVTEGGAALGEAREPLTPVGGFFCGLVALSLVGLAPFSGGASAAYAVAWAVACAIL